MKPAAPAVQEGGGAPTGGLLDRLAVLGRNCGGWIPLGIAGFLLVGTRQSFTVPFTGLGLPPALLLLLGLGILWCLTRIAGQRYPLGLGVLGAAVAVRFCLLLISYGLGSGQALTPDQRMSADRLIVTEAGAMLVVIVTATLLRSRHDLMWVIRALVAGGALSGFFALVQYATGLDLAARAHLPGLQETIAPLGFDLVRQGLVRADGAAAQPLELAAVTTTLLPLAVAGYFVSRRRGERAWWWAMAGALMLGGAAVSQSRSVFAGLAVAGLVMASRWPLRRTLALLGGVLVIVIAALVSGAQVVEALVTTLTQGSDDFSLGSRQVGRDYVVAHVTDHFWWGQGPGTYDSTLQPVLDNQYLTQLLEAGAIGLLAMIAVTACALWYALMATARTVDPDLRELAIGISGSLVALMLIQTVLDTAGFVQIFVLGWLCIGLAATVWRLAVAQPNGPTPTGSVLTPAAAAAR